MKILSTMMLSEEGTLSPILTILTLENNMIYRYSGIKLSSIDIQDINNSCDESFINSFIEKLIKNIVGEKLSPEQALIEYPSTKNSIIHLLRDKKIDDLIY